MKHLQKIAWLGGLMVATSGLIASPAHAGDLDVTGKFSMKGKLPVKTEGKFTEIGLPLAHTGKLGFEKTFDLEEGSINGVLKLGLGKKAFAMKVEDSSSDNASDHLAKSLFNTPEILEAYLEYGILRMGLSKSILSDKDSAPTVLGNKFSKPAGDALPQFRWTLANDEFTYAFAAEVGQDMQAVKYEFLTMMAKEKAAKAAEAAGKKARKKPEAIKQDMQVAKDNITDGLRLPDLVASINYEIDEESHMKGALGLKVRKPGDKFDFKLNGLIAGKYSVAPEFAVMGQVAVSELDPSKVSNISNIKNTVSGVLGLEYQFVPEATGTLAWTADAGTVTNLGGNLAANVMYDMTSSLSAGAEFNVINVLDGSRDMGFSTVVSLKL